MCCLRDNAIYLGCLKLIIAGLEVQKGKGDQNGLLNGALSRYIKRKKLEPLDSYLSQILLSDAQLQKLGKLHFCFTIRAVGKETISWALMQ